MVAVFFQVKNGITVTRRELLAVVHFTKYYKNYLLGKNFLLRTDHGSLRWLFGFKEPQGQLARWLEQLFNFDFTIEHRAGRLHRNLDALSRIPCTRNCKSCGGDGKKEEYIAEEAGMQDTSSYFPFKDIRNIRRLYFPSREGRQDHGRRNRKRRQKRRATHVQCTRTDELVLRACHTTEDKNDEDSVNIVSPITKEQIKEGQDGDLVLVKVKSWTRRPTWEEISAEEADVKYYAARWEQLSQEDGILLYRWENEDASTSMKYVLPPPLQKMVLQSTHNHLLAGHFGVDRTYMRVKESMFMWPHMHATVEDWCRKCDLCARSKPIQQKRRAPMQTYLSGEPIERVSVDILGPLSETLAGNKYILVLGDHFTKWMEAYPIPDHTPDTVATYLVTEFICRFGIPLQIHIDQGREFESALFREMCEILEIDKTRTSIWRPQSDGMVERFNHTLQTMLKQVVDEDQEYWDAYIPMLCMAYRSSVHESTKQTPNKMMLGRELPLPVSLLIRPPMEPDCENRRTDYASRLEELITKSHEAARK